MPSSASSPPPTHPSDGVSIADGLSEVASVEVASVEGASVEGASVEALGPEGVHAEGDPPVASSATSAAELTTRAPVGTTRVAVDSIESRAAVLLASLTAATGAVLAMTYPTEPRRAAETLAVWRDGSPLGPWRDAHAWAGTGLLIAVGVLLWAALSRRFVSATTHDEAPAMGRRDTRGWRRLTWVALAVVLIGWTGGLLARPLAIAAGHLPLVFALHCGLLPLLAVFFWFGRHRSRNDP